MTRRTAGKKNSGIDLLLGWPGNWDIVIMAIVITAIYRVFNMEMVDFKEVLDFNFGISTFFIHFFINMILLNVRKIVLENSISILNTLYSDWVIKWRRTDFRFVCWQKTYLFLMGHWQPPACLLLLKEYLKYYNLIGLA